MNSDEDNNQEEDASDCRQCKNTDEHAMKNLTIDEPSNEESRRKKITSSRLHQRRPNDINIDVDEILNFNNQSLDGEVPAEEV